MVRSSGPRTASTMQNSDAPSARRLGRRGQHLVGVEEGRGLHLGVELGRLAAEVAVLGTPAGLGRQDALDLDLGPAPGQAHLVGQAGQGRDRRVGKGGQLAELVEGELASARRAGRRRPRRSASGLRSSWTWREASGGLSLATNGRVQPSWLTLAQRAAGSPGSTLAVTMAHGTP